MTHTTNPNTPYHATAPLLTPQDHARLDALARGRPLAEWKPREERDGRTCNRLPKGRNSAMLSATGSKNGRCDA